MALLKGAHELHTIPSAPSSVWDTERTLPPSPTNMTVVLRYEAGFGCVIGADIKDDEWNYNPHDHSRFRTYYLLADSRAALPERPKPPRCKPQRYAITKVRPRHREHLVAKQGAGESDLVLRRAMVNAQGSVRVRSM